MTPSFALSQSETPHISEHDLELYHLGMLPEHELMTVEDHYLSCLKCAQRAQETADYLDAMRAAMSRLAQSAQHDPDRA